MTHADSLYLKYVAEREGLSSIFEDSAFLTYKISGEECFIANMFIEPGLRGSGACRNLIDKLSKLARAKFATHITGNIHLNDKHATKTLIAAVGVGFEVTRADNNVILISKKLGGS